MQIVMSVPSNFSVLEGYWLPLLVTGRSSYFVTETSLLLKGYSSGLVL